MKNSKSCKNCEYLHEAKSKHDISFFCFRYPPRPLAVPVKSPITNQTGIEVQAIFSPVLPEGACGEYKSKI